MSESCDATVSWWDGEYEGRCEMPKDHVPTNMHYDGMAYFDDENEEVREEDVPIDVRREWSRILAGGR